MEVHSCHSDPGVIRVSVEGVETSMDQRCALMSSLFSGTCYCVCFVFVYFGHFVGVLVPDKTFC